MRRFCSNRELNLSKNLLIHLGREYTEKPVWEGGKRVVI
jgi:hypothetical protein